MEKLSYSTEIGEKIATSTGFIADGYTLIDIFLLQGGLLFLVVMLTIRLGVKYYNKPKKWWIMLLIWSLFVAGEVFAYNLGLNLKNNVIDRIEKVL